jgi:hypothetical protein
MDTDTLKVALAHAAEARKTEISLLWSRSLYFWGFIAVVIVAYGGALNVDQFTLAFLSTCIGFVLSRVGPWQIEVVNIGRRYGSGNQIIFPSSYSRINYSRHIQMSPSTFLGGGLPNAFRHQSSRWR